MSDKFTLNDLEKHLPCNVWNAFCGQDFNLNSEKDIVNGIAYCLYHRHKNKVFHQKYDIKGFKNFQIFKDELHDFRERFSSNNKSAKERRERFKKYAENRIKSIIEEKIQQEKVEEIISRFSDLAKEIKYFHSLIENIKLKEAEKRIEEYVKKFESPVCRKVLTAYFKIGPYIGTILRIIFRFFRLSNGIPS